MRREITVFALSLVLGLISSVPSSAVFGLSKCEKVKRQILSEEKISIVLYSIARKTRDAAIADNSATWGEYAKVLTKDILGRQSDGKVYDLMLQNPNCYSAEINANVRFYKRDLQKYIKSTNLYIEEISNKSWTNVVNAEPLTALKSFKWGFVSVYDKDFLKKMYH